MTSTRKPGAGRPPLENPPDVIHIALRLYTHDADLKRWLDGIPTRQRSAAVKAALRGGIQQSESHATDSHDDALDMALSSLLL